MIDKLTRKHYGKSLFYDANTKWGLIAFDSIAEMKFPTDGVVYFYVTATPYQDNCIPFYRIWTKDGISFENSWDFAIKPIRKKGVYGVESIGEAPVLELIENRNTAEICKYYSQPWLKTSGYGFGGCATLKNGFITNIELIRIYNGYLVPKQFEDIDKIQPECYEIRPPWLGPAKKVEQNQGLYPPGWSYKK